MSTYATSKTLTVMITIQDFWDIDDLIKNRWGKKHYDYIDYCGLEPIKPMESFGYFCTPIGSLTFAATGGDGVHFSFLKGKNPDESPIVMTIPMADKNNIIVAENLNEFFSIGYHVGWFSLEQLAYYPKETIEYFSTPDEEATDQEKQFLHLIRTNLNIQHIPLSLERLDELKNKFFHLIEISEV